MKQVFTTGQIAKICKVAPRTVSKWFDSGALRGYRIPGSQDRRVPRANLHRFMQENGLPTDELDAESTFVIVAVGLSSSDQERIAIQGEADVVTHHTSNWFSAGSLVKEHSPDCVILDCNSGRSEAIAVAMQFHGHSNRPHFVGLANEDETGFDQLAEAFDRVFVKPFDPTKLQEHLAALVDSKMELDPTATPRKNRK